MLAALCLLGCTTIDSDDPQLQVGNGRVAVDLALSVAPSQSVITRQTEAVAQAQDPITINDFRGIMGIQTADPLVTLFSYDIDGNLTDGIFPGFVQKKETATYHHYYSK